MAHRLLGHRVTVRVGEVNMAALGLVEGLGDDELPEDASVCGDVGANLHLAILEPHRPAANGQTFENLRSEGLNED